ncbi:MAG: hypothetical protein ACK5IJ_00520 [Mangrovibacterium sp.]
MITKIACINYNSTSAQTSGITKLILKSSESLGNDTTKHLSNLLQKIKDTESSLNSVIVRKCVKTNLPEKIDHVKSCFYRFFQLIDSYSAMCDMDFHSSAKALMEVMLPSYEKIMKCSQQLTFISYVSALIAALERRELREMRSSLSFADHLFNKLKESKHDCVDCHNDYHDTRTQQKNNPNATELRLTLLVLINQDLVPYLNTMNKVDSVNYSAFSNTINSIIKDHNKILKRKSKSKKNVREKD